MLWKGDQSPRVKKERKPTLRRKWERVFSGRHTDNVPAEETHVVSVMIQESLETGIPFEGKTDWRRGTKKPHRDVALKQKNSLDESELPCRFKFCKNTSCGWWRPPVCPNYRSEKGCVHGDKCHFRHVEAERKPNKKSKKGLAKVLVTMLKESQDSYPRKSLPREQGTLGSKHTVKISKGIWHQIKKIGKEGVHREGSSKSVRLMSVVLACLNSWNDHMRRPCTKKDAPVGFGEKYSQAQEFGQNYVLYILLKKTKVMPAPTSTRPEEREFVVGSGASMHMMSKKE